MNLERILAGVASKLATAKRLPEPSPKTLELLSSTCRRYQVSPAQLLGEAPAKPREEELR